MMRLETLAQDARYGIRMLWRNAGFTVVAILALALGIGVNTSVFTAYKALVARPLEGRDADSMVNLALLRESGGADFTFSYPDYETYRDSMRSFSGLIATKLERLRLSDAGSTISQRRSVADSGMGRLGLLPSRTSNAEFASVLAVSENYFTVLGTGLLRGAGFEGPASVLISENYWRKRFSSDPALLGRTIRLNGVAVTITGITPRDFKGTHIGVPDFWLPLQLEPLVHGDPNWLRNRENTFARVFGRLAPGVRIEGAQAEVTVVAERLRGLHDPKSGSAKPATAIVWPGSPFPLPIRAYRPLTLAILLIMAAAVMVLAIACADVAGLQLARGRSRQNEVQTRLALGASRMRVVRQLLTESVLLGLAAGCLALLLSWVFLRYGIVLAGETFPAEFGTILFNVNPDGEIFAFAFGISLVAGLLFGLAPALESSHAAASAARGSTMPARSRRIQDLLVAAQVALSLVLMIAGSMFIRSALNSLHLETGYDSKHVVDLDVQFPEGNQYNEARKRALVEELRSRVSTLSGVADVTSARPPAALGFRTAAADPEDTNRAKSQSMLYYVYVQPNYFATAGIPLVLGRSFETRSGQAEQSVLVSESAARQLWPDKSPIGRKLRLGLIDERFHLPADLAAGSASYEVIGIVHDVRGAELDQADSKEIYLPLSPEQITTRPLLIRTSDPAEVLRSVDTIIPSLDTGLTANASTLEAMLRQSPPFLASSMAAAIASTVGLFGLLLAAMGIYGTASYLVVLRTREVGIRMAIGAPGRAVLGLVVRQSMRAVVGGVLSGLLLAMVAAYGLRGLFYGLATVDILSFAGVPVIFLTIALLAVYPPARRATRVDPIMALRQE